MSVQGDYKYFYDVIRSAAERYPDRETFRKRNAAGEIRGRTYRDLLAMTDQITAGLIQQGIQIGDRVTYLCDTSKNWIVTDIAIVTSGGVTTPRGTDVTTDDIVYIVTHSESRFAIVQKEKDRKRLQDLKGQLPSLEKIFVMEDDEGEVASGPDTLNSLIEEGKKALEKNPDLVQERLKQTDPDELATLIYTSGTTGAPKGVMLNQTGWLVGVINTLKRVGFTSDDTAVSLLPPWHAFERAVEYAVCIMGMDYVVTDINVLRDDLKEYRPTIFPSVPRIWESVYNGIMAKIQKESAAKQKIFYFCLSVGATWARHKAILGGYDYQIHKPFILLDGLRRLYSLLVLILISPGKLLAMKVFSKIKDALGGRIRISVSGGSALPGVVDRFLSAIGILVLEGYGMTETSAIIAIRRRNKPTSGTVGTPVPGYQIKLVDDQNNIVNGIGKKGSLWVKSDQILFGYYKRPDLKTVFDEEGFFNTGDIMMLNHRGELMFAGRAKDTIALAGGENIEPVPIEDKLLQSPYIDQVMVVGDDKKTLGAIVVPNYDRIRDEFTVPAKAEDWDKDPVVRKLYRQEISSMVCKETGFKSFEMIPGNCFYVSPRAFDTDTEMTRTLKMKRPIIKENFAREIDYMYK